MLSTGVCDTTLDTRSCASPSGFSPAILPEPDMGLAKRGLVKPRQFRGFARYIIRLERETRKCQKHFSGETIRRTREDTPILGGQATFYHKGARCPLSLYTQRLTSFGDKTLSLFPLSRYPPIAMKARRGRWWLCRLECWHVVLFCRHDAEQAPLAEPENAGRTLILVRWHYPGCCA